MKNKGILVVVVALCAALLVTACAAPAPAPTPAEPTPAEPTPATPAEPTPAAPEEYPLGKAVIKFAGQDICSGMNADYGRQMIMGAELAIDQINASGGILGSQCEMNFRDTEFNPDLTVRNAQWQATEWGADAFFGYSYEAGVYAMAEHLEEWDLLFQGCHCGDSYINEKYVYEQGHYNVFKLSTAYYVDGNLPALYLLIGNDEIKSWGNMNADYGYGLSVGDDHMLATMEANGCTIPCVACPGAPYGTADFTTHIATLMAAKPNFILGTPWAGEAVSVLRQAVVAGLFDQDWFKCWFQAMGASVDVAEGITGDVQAGKFNGKLWATARYIWNQNDRPENVAFVEAFKDRYAGRYPNYSAATCYTAIYIYKKAMEQTGNLETADLMKAMEGMEVWDMPLGNIGEDGRPPLWYRPEDHVGCYTVPAGRYTYTPEVGVAHLTDFSNIPWFDYYRNPPDYEHPVYEPWMSFKGELVPTK